MYFRNRDEEPLLPTFDPSRKYKDSELDRLADEILRADVKSEICRSCGERGQEVGRVPTEQDPVDGEGNPLTVEFPEYTCSEGHNWFEGEGRTRTIGGENPILFDEHIYQRKKREIHCAAGSPDPEIVSGSYNRCVDIDTRALTLKGWGSVYNLSKGDLICSYKNGTYLWQPISDIFIKKFKGEINSLEGVGISAKYTHGHRWAIKNGDIVSETKGLTKHHWIPTPDGDLPLAGAIFDVEFYDGDIWCPTVESGFWLAQRCDTAYVTGNSHPSGRKMNTKSQRANSGASFYRAYTFLPMIYLMMGYFA